MKNKAVAMEIMTGTALNVFCWTVEELHDHAIPDSVFMRA
jgi:hypothetical protein